MLEIWLRQLARCVSQIRCRTSGRLPDRFQIGTKAFVRAPDSDRTRSTNPIKFRMTTFPIGLAMISTRASLAARWLLTYIQKYKCICHCRRTNSNCMKRMSRSISSPAKTASNTFEPISRPESLPRADLPNRSREDCQRRPRSFTANHRNPPCRNARCISYACARGAGSGCAVKACSTAHPKAR